MSTLYVSDAGAGVLGAAGFGPRLDWADPLIVGPVRTGSDEERAPVLERLWTPEEVADHLRERRALLAAADDFDLWLQDTLAGWLQLLQIHDRIPAGAPVRLRLEPEPLSWLRPDG